MSVFHVYGPNITLVMAITLEIVVLLVICLAKSQNLLHFNNQDQRSGDGSSYCLAIVYYYSIMSVFDVYGPIITIVTVITFGNCCLVVTFVRQHHSTNCTSITKTNNRFGGGLYYLANVYY